MGPWSVLVEDPGAGVLDPPRGPTETGLVALKPLIVDGAENTDVGETLEISADSVDGDDDDEVDMYVETDIGRAEEVSVRPGGSDMLLGAADWVPPCVELLVAGVAAVPDSGESELLPRWGVVDDEALGNSDVDVG